MNNDENCVQNAMFAASESYSGSAYVFEGICFEDVEETVLAEEILAA